MSGDVARWRKLVGRDVADGRVGGRDAADDADQNQEPAVDALSEREFSSGHIRVVTNSSDCPGRGRLGFRLL